MDISETAFKILLLLFPGILCAYLVNSLTIHRPRDAFSFLMQSFVLGITAYFAYWLILRGISFLAPGSVNPDLTFFTALISGKTDFRFSEIFWTSVCAIVIGLVASLTSKYKWLNRVARRLGITKKFGELDVWGYMLNTKEVVWVTVRDHVNDLIIDGWVQAFSDNSKDAELLLRDVSIYKNSTGDRLYQVGLLYIARERGTISIECRTIPIDEQYAWKEQDKNEQTQGNT